MKNSQNKELKVKLETFETWRGGISNAYYEPHTCEVHILNLEDLHTKILWHEEEHHKRRNKATFKLASVMQTPLLLALLLGVFYVLAAYAVASVFIMPEGLLLHSIPLSFVACLIIFFSLCVSYEERQADRAVLRELARYQA